MVPGWKVISRCEKTPFIKESVKTLKKWNISSRYLKPQHKPLDLRKVRWREEGGWDSCVVWIKKNCLIKNWKLGGFVFAEVSSNLSWKRRVCWLPPRISWKPKLIILCFLCSLCPHSSALSSSLSAALSRWSVTMRERAFLSTKANEYKCSLPSRTKTPVIWPWQMRKMGSALAEAHVAARLIKAVSD